VRGLEVIHRTGWGADVPLIAFGYGNVIHENSAAIGAVAAFQKPFDAGMFMSTVVRLVKTRPKYRYSEIGIRYGIPGTIGNLCESGSRSLFFLAIRSPSHNQDGGTRHAGDFSSMIVVLDEVVDMRSVSRVFF
jgi:hypothetical protein